MYQPKHWKIEDGSVLTTPPLCIDIMDLFHREDLEPIFYFVIVMIFSQKKYFRVKYLQPLKKFHPLFNSLDKFVIIGNNLKPPIKF